MSRRKVDADLSERVSRSMREMAQAKLPPQHDRKCPTCGAVMLWLPLKDVFGRLYRWRAWCDVHGHAKRNPSN